MTPPGVTAPPDPVARLQRYSRFIALVAEQLDAMRENDAERLRRLTEERQLLERELSAELLPEDPSVMEGVHDVGDTAAEGPALARLHDELGNAVSEVEERLDAERWKEEQWTLLSDGAIRSARSVPAVRPIARNYPELEARTSHLDRRL